MVVLVRAERSDASDGQEWVTVTERKGCFVCGVFVSALCGTWGSGEAKRLTVYLLRL